MSLVLAEISDTVWLALIAAVVTVINAIMSQRTKNAVVKTAADAAVAVEEVKTTAAKAATAVEQVKTTLEESTLATTKKLNDVADVAKEAVAATEQVRVTLKENTDASTANLEGVAKVCEETKSYVNGAMAFQMQQNAGLARAKADATHHPGDVAVADLAEKALIDHMDTKREIEKGKA